MYRMIGPEGPVETFDVSTPPSPARITARGEAFVSALTRKHMAGPGTAWFEPTGPLIFDLDSGDTHVIPREHIKAVDPHVVDTPLKGDEQPLKLNLTPASPLFVIIVYSKSTDQNTWTELRPTGD
ncbi:hypothetical protein [Streptomyces sp. XC 2026]|uniref:hypothetical protein n=1 Tax=Streptomyces sp. XC 2026 TaxID=2782004 RepID=UPI00190378EE|nr:hypothetical protein [Streptomyces sp. XC 2026]QQN78562.1 hypothetical protein IPZ77_14745 [Streptomyces sp. XC 2026]